MKKTDKIVEILKDEMGDRFDQSWAETVADRIDKIYLEDYEKRISKLEENEIENYLVELGALLSYHKENNNSYEVDKIERLINLLTKLEEK